MERHGLLASVSGPGKGADLAGVIDTLGFVQLDSVNTFARAHDLIMWTRRQQYRPSALEQLLSSDRKLFEHWTHDASTIPIAHFPQWRMRFIRSAKELESRWAKDRREGFLTKIDEVMKQITDEGCCGSSDVGRGEVKGSGGWWDWHPSKTALEYLWHAGHLSVVRREGFRKIYDLTERVIPSELLHQHIDEEESIEWHCNEALDRLGFASSIDLARFWATLTRAETKQWCERALAAGEIIEVDVISANGKPQRCFARPDILDCELETPSSRVRIMSPFDPMLRDRKRAERLFDFSYRIEIFVPEVKRIYGYYVFPVLEADQMIGRIDMKADRKAKRLNVTAFWPEVGTKMGTGRIGRLRAELERAARFSGCDEVVYQDDWLRV
jgi:uncharacterized protein YcaQ